MILSSAFTFEFGEDGWCFGSRDFSLAHTVVEILQHWWLENDYPDVVQGSRTVIAQHVNHRIQHGICHLLCINTALT